MSEKASELPAARSAPELVATVESVECGSPVEVSLAAPTASLEDVSVSLKCVTDPSSSLEGEVVGNGVGIFSISVTPQVRGRHDLIVKVKDKEIAGSPFRVFVKLPPSQLGKSGSRLIGGLYKIWGMAFNNKQQLMVIETGISLSGANQKKRVTIVERDGGKVGVIQCDKFQDPHAIAQSSDGSIFVADSGVSVNCLFKFGPEGQLLHCEHSLFEDFPPFEVAMIIIDDEIYILDGRKKLVRIFDTHCKAVGSIDVKECDMPTDIAQGPDGLYVTGYGIYVYECAPNGALIRQLEFALSSPNFYFRGIIFDPSCRIVASDASNGVYVFTVCGECVGHVTSEAQDTDLDDGVPYVEEPGRLTIDTDGYVYVHSYRSSTRIFVL
ncbi:hypothetical protein GBAR_LOCUS11205 [Geodia barretti]|uniref:Uncharacterized protein n=1 Tax=Geodia barretti TaxID=519541 RepID=A0AA35WEH8_GEOBA|nr:hypothetical protein GBAR_LOCUS11205 [Geodia barretti]